jgi:fibronectin-binding autotransporter adhesin
VHLLTGSKINGNLGLSGTTSSTLILDGASQQLLSLAVTGTVTNNGTLVKQGSSTWTIDRALDAPLGTDILAGTLIVEAVLTTAQVNVATGAVLQLNSGGSVGGVVVDGSLIFANSGTVNHNEVISGPGNVIQNGTGTTILSGKNTYSGGTIIDLGALLVNNAKRLAPAMSPSTEAFWELIPNRSTSWATTPRMPAAPYSLILRVVHPANSTC